MRRFIEILKEFQNNSRSLSLSYLTVKFSLTIRTLQRDVQRINTLLAAISNCKITKSKDQLILIGDHANSAINRLLNKFSAFSNNKEIKSYQLLLSFIWANQPLTNSKLINFTNSSSYALKQQLNLINNFLQYYRLKLSLKFKAKKGWELIGSEQDLRLLATNILIKLDHNDTLFVEAKNPADPNYLDFNLFHLCNKLKKVLSNANIYQYYYSEVLYFLVVVVRRIKINKILSNYHCHEFLTKLVNSEKTIKQHCDELVNLLQKSFALKFNSYEIAYLKSLMFCNQKQFNSFLFSNLILKLKNFIIKLIFKKYQLSLTVKSFSLTIKNFLQENFLKLLLNFYQSFSFNDSKKTLFSNGTSYFFGWEMLKIINFAFKQFNINIDFNLFISNNWLMNFNKFYLRSNQTDWIIPLYYRKDSDSLSWLNGIVLFLQNNYSNLAIKSLDMNNNVYEWNVLNKQYAIFLGAPSFNQNLLHGKILLVKYHRGELIQQLETRINFAIETIMFNKLCSSIFVLDFFLKQKFCSLKTFLNFFQNLLVRKFKINYFDFDLKDAFIDEKFFQAHILLVHKLVPINNIELPIILIYVNSPLFFFHKRKPIHFIFILINNAKNLYRYDWMITYLNLIKNNFNIKITNSKNIYQIFNNSLSHGSLVY